MFRLVVKRGVELMERGFVRRAYERKIGQPAREPAIKHDAARETVA